MSPQFSMTAGRHMQERVPPQPLRNTSPREVAHPELSEAPQRAIFFQTRLFKKNVDDDTVLSRLGSERVSFSHPRARWRSCVSRFGGLRSLCAVRANAQSI